MLASRSESSSKHLVPGVTLPLRGSVTLRLAGDVVNGGCVFAERINTRDDSPRHVIHRLAAIAKPVFAVGGLTDGVENRRSIACQEESRPNLDSSNAHRSRRVAKARPAGVT